MENVVTHEIKAKVPRIYVASLADYNAGRLHGCWIDADQPADAIQERISQMLAESPELVAEDWAIHDYENFHGLRLIEFEDIEKVSKAAFHISQYGPLFALLVDHLGGTSAVEEACRYMVESYHGPFESLSDYVYDFVGQCYYEQIKHLPEFIQHHIDYEGIAHDMELNGDVFTLTCEGHVHVFDANI